MNTITINASYKASFEYLISKSGMTLNEYQLQGVMWCIKNEINPNPVHNVRGGIIADEMGLGKTLCMIGTIYSHFLRHTLIVVPPILVQQWVNEIARITGHRALVYYGLNKKSITRAQLDKSIIVITTYNTLVVDKYLLKSIEWDRIIYDEAHHLRNSKTVRFIHAQALKSPIRWLVTGTPIQNSCNDFYNLCHMLGLPKSYYSISANLKTLRDIFVLRRTKSQVGIILPALTTTVTKTSWKDIDECNFAREMHSLLPNQTFVAQTDNMELSCAYSASGITRLTACLRARQICIMPSLLRDNITKNLINTNLLSPEYCPSMEYSSKIDAVMDVILSRATNNRGKIIFCHFQKEIDTIASRLRAKGLVNVLTYDGRTSKSDFEQIISTAQILIIQIQTGCEGINLQQNFSEIYFVSPHWNPAVEQQAIARCHRIGQTKPVDVFKFIMQGFDEECKALEVPTKSLESAIKSLEVPTNSLETYVRSQQDLKQSQSDELLDYSEIINVMPRRKKSSKLYN